MSFRSKNCLRYLMVATLFATAFVWMAIKSPSARSCTIFTAAQGDTVLFGNNEDWHSPTPMIGFRPATSAGYGSIYVGFRHSDGSIEFGGAMNDQGLAWDINGLPRSALNPHPERPYSHREDNYLTTITRRAATVTDAIRMAQDFDFGDSMSIQIHIADATGDAVVISAGPDGEIAFTRKANGDGHLVSTNFNLADPDNGTIGWRYDTAASMLDQLGASQDLTAGFAGQILDAVHLETLTSYTLYSNVFDLGNRRIYLYYMAQYAQVVELDLTEELSHGERTMEMQSLFAPDTVSAGQAAYQQFESRFRMAQFGAGGAILAALGGGALLVVKRFR